MIISPREDIRDVEKDCAVCRRRRAKLAAQFTASLTDVQLIMSLQPFTHAVIDYSRIASLRGIPEVMFDNGSNFVKSDKELKDLVNQTYQEKINQTIANKRVQ